MTHRPRVTPLLHIRRHHWARAVGALQVAGDIAAGPDRAPFAGAQGALADAFLVSLLLLSLGPRPRLGALLLLGRGGLFRGRRSPCPRRRRRVRVPLAARAGCLVLGHLCEQPIVQLGDAARTAEIQGRAHAPKQRAPLVVWQLGGFRDCRLGDARQLQLPPRPLRRPLRREQSPREQSRRGSGGRVRSLAVKQQPILRAQRLP